MLLPSPSELRALKAIQRQQSGTDVVINLEDVESCIDKGWAESVGNLRYALTQKGQSLLI